MTIIKILIIILSGLILSCLSAQDINAVIISTDKLDYSGDEKIKIFVINKLDSTIIYARNVHCGASFFELNDCNGNNIIYHDLCMWDDYQHGFSELESNDTLIGYWYRTIYKDLDFENAQTGCYKILFPYFIKRENEKLRTWNDRKRIIYSNEFKLN
jgi:hypothetical protein